MPPTGFPSYLHRLALIPVLPALPLTCNLKQPWDSGIAGGWRGERVGGRGRDHGLYLLVFTVLIGACSLWPSSQQCSIQQRSHLVKSPWKACLQAKGRVAPDGKEERSGGKPSGQRSVGTKREVLVVLGRYLFD